MISKLRVRRMEKWLNAGRYDKIINTDPHAILRSKNGWKAALYLATSLCAIKTKEAYQEAVLFLEMLPAHQRPDPATYHYLRANALKGRDPSCNVDAILAKVVQRFPDYVEEIEANPVFEGCRLPQEAMYA